jgi:hypothetical protein
MYNPPGTYSILPTMRVVAVLVIVDVSVAVSLVVSVEEAVAVADDVRVESAVDVKLDVAVTDAEVVAVLVCVDAVQLRKVPSTNPVSATLREAAFSSHRATLVAMTSKPSASHDTFPNVPG